MKSITYQCIECNNLRRLTLPENHSDHLMLTHNGLNIYSDFHKCDLGLLGVNNIHVDENLNVRTIEPLQLPKEKKVQTSNNFIPKPTLSQQYTTLNIASVANVSNFRFVMIDSSLKIILNVGKVNENNETPEFSVISAHNNIQVSFYSQIGEISNMKLWMQTIIDLLEKLPPTNFGLLIESLRHMQSLIKIEPAIFHVELLKTILVSHEIFFGKGANINQKGHLLQIASDNYGNDAAYDLAILLDKIEKSPELPLIEFTKSTNLDIVTLIYMILILEQEDAIIVHRPKFIEFN